MDVWRHGGLWGVGWRKAHLASCATSSGSQIPASSEPKMSGGESRASSGQTAPRHHCFSGLHCYSLWCHWNVQVSRIFNVKWAKIRRFLLIQWIDFLLWSVQEPIINVYLFLMGVQDCPHYTGLVNVHAGNCEFVYVGYVSSRNCVCAYQCMSSKNTDPWSAFWQEAFTSCQFTCLTLCQ